MSPFNSMINYIKQFTLPMIFFLTTSPAMAQGGDGKGTPPRRPIRSTCNVTVMIEEPGNGPLSKVEVKIKEITAKRPRTKTNIKSLLTKSDGTVLAKLTCEREYSFTPKLQGYKFNSREISKTLTQRATLLSFSAEKDISAAVPDRDPTPAPEPCNREQKVLKELEMGMPGRSSSHTRTLSPENSACQSPGIYTDTYPLTGALGGDMVVIKLQQPANSSFTLRINEQDYKPDEVFKVEVPKSGNYQVKVSVTNTNAPLKSEDKYTITVERVGLTDNGYTEQIRRVVEILGQPPEEAVYSALQPPVKKLDEAVIGNAVKELGKLTQLDPKRPAAFEMLGLLRLYFNQDRSDAFKLMKQAIENDGAARFLVFQGVNVDKSRKGVYLGWLAISRGKAEFYYPTQKKPRIATITQRINKCGIRNRLKDIFFIKESKWPNSADFYPMSKDEMETKEIFDLLKHYVCPAEALGKR